MFRELRRKDREISEAEAMEILNGNEYGVLSTVGEDGYPYGIPVNYIVENGAVYFHCAVAGHKLENIVFNSRVSFCVVGKTKIIPEKFTTKYESVVIFGTAMEAEGEERQDAFMGIVDKFSKDFAEKGQEHIMAAGSRAKIIKIKIEHIQGKAHK